MPDVIVKGEYHHSRGDFEDEEALLEDNNSAVVLEGAERDTVRYTFLNAWFLLTTQFLMHFMKRIQTEKDELAHKAGANGIEVIYTRESNDRIAEIAPQLLLLTSSLLSIAMLVQGIQTGMGATTVAAFLDGFSWMVSGVAAPLVVLRLFNTFSGQGDSNRNRKIASTAKKALDEHDGTVLVITGYAHMNGVVDALEEQGIDVEARGPAYSFTDPRFYRDLALPGLEVFTTFFGMYTVLLLVLHWLVAAV